jgi:CheY-like chemotaxis protein/anti-sigma regulatory factor (Ser/Thr protein kinase)
MVYNQIRYRAKLIKEYGQVPPVMANRGRLAQVFLNLLVNAAHAIEEGDEQGNRIRVRTWSEEGEVLVEVSDTGRGIPPENMDRLFEPFFTTKTGGTGFGLGLSICQKIATDYGGRIEVQSTAGKGTTFTVHLPAATQEQVEAAVTVPPKMLAGDPRARGRVLVVDDEVMVGRAVKRVLGREHEVTVATSGEEAKRILEKDRDFDVLISDLLMPDVTGMDLHEWLQERNPKLGRRTVFMTGGAFTPRAREFLDRVPNTRLEKPVEPQNLLEIVRNLVIAGRS